MTSSAPGRQVEHRHPVRARHGCGREAAGDLDRQRRGPGPRDRDQARSRVEQERADRAVGLGPRFNDQGAIAVDVDQRGHPRLADRQRAHDADGSARRAAVDAPLDRAVPRILDLGDQRDARRGGRKPPRLALEDEVHAIDGQHGLRFPAAARDRHELTPLHRSPAAGRPHPARPAPPRRGPDRRRHRPSRRSPERPRTHTQPRRPPPVDTCSPHTPGAVLRRQAGCKSD